MAIQRGFPPSNTISPSVRIAEKDLSFIAPEQSFHRAGLVGFASKGPINIPTVVASTRQLHTLFGYGHPDVGDPYMIYAAEQYLLVANELYIVRVADTDAVSDERADTADVDVVVSGGVLTLQSDTAGAYRFDTDCFFKWELNGVPSAKTLYIAANDGDNPSYTCEELVEELNSQLEVTTDGIEFACTEDDKISVSTTFSYGPSSSLELISVQNSIYGAPVAGRIETAAVGSGTGSDTLTVTNSDIFEVGDTILVDGVSKVISDIDYDIHVITLSTTATWADEDIVSKETLLCGQTNLGNGMTQAESTSDAAGYSAGYATDGTWDFASLTNLQLLVVVDGSDNVNIDNVVQVIDLEDLEGLSNTTEDIVNEINSQITDGTIPGGFYAVGGGAVDGPTVDGIVIDLSTHTLYNADNITLVTLHSGVDARILVKSESTAFEIFDFDGFTDAGTSPSGVTGDSDIDEAAIVVGASVSSVNSFTITADSAGIEGNSTQVIITNNVRDGNFTMDVYSNGVQVETWGNLTKDSTSRFYVSTYLAEVSDYIRVTDNTDTAATPKNGTYTLTGGSDGIPSDPDLQDALLIGNDLGFTGMYALSEPEQIDIDLMACPGHSSTAVILGLISVCRDFRMDCMAIIDPPFGLTVNEIIKWQNGVHPLNTTKLDSDFAALYWPWVKLRDNHNLVDVWVPPSGSVMAVYARNDQLAAPWFAPAGTTRGIVPAITDVYNRPSLEERDLMYGYRNAINPIITFPNLGGFVVWGQKTLQRNPTALDRVNVRRLMFVAEKRIRAASRVLLFDPNDEEFQRKFIQIATSILQEIQVGRGIHDFIIQADSTLNTPDVIDRNEFRARIGIQPTRAAEFIFIEFSVHRTGSFTENANTF